MWVIGGRDIHRAGHVMEIVGSMVRICEGLGSRETPIQPLTSNEGAPVTHATSVDVSFLHYKVL